MWMITALGAAFFAWALFREVHLNWGIAFGALLIISGMGFVSYFAK